MKTTCSMPVLRDNIWTYTCTQGDYRRIFFTVSNYKACLATRRQTLDQLKEQQQ